MTRSFVFHYKCQGSMPTLVLKVFFLDFFQCTFSLHADYDRCLLCSIKHLSGQYLDIARAITTVQFR